MVAHLKPDSENSSWAEHKSLSASLISKSTNCFAGSKRKILFFSKQSLKDILISLPLPKDFPLFHLLKEHSFFFTFFKKLFRSLNNRLHFAIIEFCRVRKFIDYRQCLFFFRTNDKQVNITILIIIPLSPTAKEDYFMA